MPVLGNALVVEILDAQVVDNLEQKGEVEQYEVDAVITWRYGVLHHPLNAEQVKRLDQPVDGNEKYQIQKKFPVKLHRREITKFIRSIVIRMVSKSKLPEAIDPANQVLTPETKEFYIINDLLIDEAMFGRLDTTFVNWLLAHGDADTAFDDSAEEVDFRCTEWHIYAGRCLTPIALTGAGDVIETRGPCPQGQEFVGVETIEYSDDCYGSGGYWDFFPTGGGSGSGNHWYDGPGISGPILPTYDNHPVLGPIMSLCNHINEVQSGEVVNGQTFTQADIDRCDAIQTVISQATVTPGDLAWLAQNDPAMLTTIANYLNAGNHTPSQIESLNAYIHLLAQGQTEMSFVAFMRLYHLVFDNLVPTLGLTQEEGWDLMAHEDLAKELKTLLDHENNSEDAKAIADVLVDISIENDEITDEQVIGLVDEFDVYLDAPNSHAEELLEYFENNHFNFLAIDPKDFLLSSDFEEIPTISGSWQPFSPSVIWTLTGSIKTALLIEFPQHSTRINKLFTCRVLGPALETSALLSMHQNHYNQYMPNPGTVTAKPDAFFLRPIGHSLQQPVIIEVKGVFGATTFKYERNPNQYQGYLTYLDEENHVYRRHETILHGFHLIIPGGVSVDDNIIQQATQRNIPFVVSHFDYNPENSAQIKLTTPQILNFESLNRSGHLLDFLPDFVFEDALERRYIRDFFYDDAPMDFQATTDVFKIDYLMQNNTPDDCPDGEDCE